MKKKAAKKKTVIKEGITSKKTKTGINVTISTNGRILCMMRGYNNNQNVQKGLRALWGALNKAVQPWAHKPHTFEVIDLTKK